MEVISRLIKVQLPNYLRSLPIPASLGGFAQLSGGEWIQLVPFVVTTSVVIYVVVSSARDTLVPKMPDPKASFVNKDIQKEKDKVANVIDVEDLGEKTAYCRCWKSKKFPLCDGSHNAHNKETGDNVGPVVIKKTV